MNPFEKTAAGTVSDWGEERLIDAIREWLGTSNRPPPEGIGDDCAVFSPTPGSRSLVTTDPIVWKRHFDETVTPEQAAAKVLKRNLSDIAAMGGKPRIAVISLLLAPKTSIDWLKRFYTGLRECALKYDVSINGGDVSEAECLAASLTLIGETISNHLLTRNGALPGDHLFVCDDLGGSLLGGHTDFVPRLKEGQWLAQRPEVTAAIDISDGIAKEIRLILPPGCEAEIDPDAVPVSSAAKKMAKKTGKDPLFHAFSDGEDYELLFAVKPEASDQLAKSWRQELSIPLHKIGRIQRAEDPTSKTFLRGLPAELAAELRPYEHFR